MNSPFSPVPLVLFGVPFHNVTFEEAIEWVVQRIRNREPGFIATANLDFLAQAQHDPDLRTVLCEADLVIADGFPPVQLAPWFGPPLKGRVTGSDITPMLAERAASEGFSIYGLGAAEGVAAAALEKLKERHPDLQVAGAWSPPYAPLELMDHQAILDRLADARPDLLLTAFGAPKQDKFNHMHVRTWDIPVAIGIGGTLDFIAGVQHRAPVWIQRLDGEWLWRWLSNPKRLTRRYSADLLFLARAAALALQQRAGRNHPSPVDEAAVHQLRQNGVRVERFSSFASAEQAGAFVETFDSSTRLAIDLRDVPRLSSLDLGALLLVSRRVESIVLLHAGSKVRRLLDFSKLTDRLPVCVVTKKECRRSRPSESSKGDAGLAGAIATEETGQTAQ